MPTLVTRPSDLGMYARRRPPRQGRPVLREQPLHVAFGKAVRRLREERGISQEELAYRAGLHRNYAGKIERGAPVPTLRTVSAIAQALEIRPSELIARAEQA
jgi:XRE family transcriptional regulator, regulator of sulfur utilization